MNHEGLYVSHQPTGFGKTHLGLAGGSGTFPRRSRKPQSRPYQKNGGGSQVRIPESPIRSPGRRKSVILRPEAMAVEQRTNGLVFSLVKAELGITPPSPVGWEGAWCGTLSRHGRRILLDPSQCDRKRLPLTPNFCLRALLPATGPAWRLSRPDTAVTRVPGSLGGHTLKLPKGLVSQRRSDWPDSEVRSLPFGRRGHPVVRIFSFGPVARHPIWTYNVNCGPRGPVANRN
jgi:hypothetical protein